MEKRLAEEVNQFKAFIQRQYEVAMNSLQIQTDQAKEIKKLGDKFELME
jgi:hypothetical protein